MIKYLFQKSNFQYLRALILAAMLAALLLAGFQVSPAYAAAPRTGVVQEGTSVPGAALGNSRAQVEAAFDQPSSCQDLPYYDGRRGVDGICDFPVDGGGQVTVHYKAPDGGPANGTDEDIVFNFRWSQQVDGWTTTAGVNTSLALEDPDAAIAAYPNATVIYNPTFGNIESIEDKALGILIDYHFNYLSGNLSVSMVISNPSDAPPVEDRPMRVTAIDLRVVKRDVIATVKVQDDLSRNVFGATVSATWSLPRGKSAAVEGTTDGFGEVEFRINKARRGAYTLTIDDIVAEGFVFDLQGSVLSATITK
jgi:hypothetical protein